MELLESTESQDAIPTYTTEGCHDNCASTDSQISNNSSGLPTILDDQTDDVCEIPPPHDDWQFNMFLDDIAEEIKTEELDKMKFYLSGPSGITKRELEKITTPLHLFTILKTRQLLTRDNLIYLQQLLRQLHRKDLITRAVDFAQKCGNVIHFYTASDQPENGFSYVKFHVEGKNFRDCTRNYVQSVRNTIAAILCVPPEFVLIAGVEPSSSLLITLMIPDLYVDIFKDLLEQNDYPKHLHELSIDIVEIQGKQYNIRGVIDAEIVATEQQQKLANVYQQMQLKNKQLEESEIERLRLDDELKEATERFSKLEKDHMQTSITLTTLEKMFVVKNICESPVSLASQSALKEFKNTLRHSEVQCCNKQVIRALVNANTEVVVNRMREEQSIRERQWKLLVDELQSQLSPLMLEIEKYRFYSEVDIDEMDKKLLESFRKLFDMLQVSVHIEPYLQILKKISRKLTSNERKILSEKYNWQSDQDLKRRMDSDESSFLASILWKEMNDKREIVDIADFISQCLRDVSRTDLLRDFNQTRKASGCRRPVSRKVRTKTAPKKSDKENAEDATTLIKMADQIQKIYDILQDSSKTFDPLSKYRGHPPPYSAHQLQYNI